MKTFNPTSPAMREKPWQIFLSLKAKRLRALLFQKSSQGGRNNYGHITSRFRGGGHKRKYRLIDFRREHIGVPAEVEGLYYDPNRSARLALLNYANGAKGFILAPVGLKKATKLKQDLKRISSQETHFLS